MLRKENSEALSRLAPRGASLYGLRGSSEQERSASCCPTASAGRAARKLLAGEGMQWSTPPTDSGSSVGHCAEICMHQRNMTHPGTALQ